MGKSQNKKVCIVLPGFSDHPVGGYKVAFEYANRFCKNGFDVSICYRCVSSEIEKLPNPFIYRLKTPLRFLKFFLKKQLGLHKTRWFKLDEAINEISCWKCNKEILSRFDCLVATSVDTAYGVKRLGLEKTKKVFYLIQGFENWNGWTEVDVLESYKFGFTNIVIAPWLAQKVVLAGATSVLITNGFDFDYFKLSSPIEERNPLKICMMNYNTETKRCSDSFAALNIVKKRFPALEVNIFGFPSRPANLPEWFHYVRMPDQKTHNFIYNDSAIYIAASRSEGFGLTIGEAMICGCAVACTNNGGFAVMAKQNETALLCDVFDVEGLAKNIIRLIEDNELRIRLAKNGNEFIKSFTWEQSAQKFISLLNG